MPSSDYKVEIVTSSGEADMSVSIVGDQVVDISGATPGDVLVVAPDGETLVTAPSSTPGAHAATHAAAGSDPVTLTIAQITSLQTTLDAKVAASLYDANTILAATVDDTPAALTVGASTIVGRKAAGGIVAMTATEAKAVLAITEADVTNLTSDLAAKAPLASPTFTGTVNVAALTASGVVTVSNGSAAAPGLAFAGQATTGFSYLATSQIILSTNGVQRVLWGNNGFSVADPYVMVLGTTTGTKIGTAANEKLAFHGSTAVVQRAGAAQAAVATTGATLAAYGFTEAQANAIVTLVNEIRAALVEKGLIKGSA